MNPTDDLIPAYTRALDAAELLVVAYRNGRRDGGHVDWNDVDRAHAAAREAVTLATTGYRQLGRWSAMPRDLLAEMRELAARLVEDNDDNADDAAEQGCRLAALVLDLDAALAAAAPPREAVAAVVDYLDGPERRDYRTTPLAVRPGHIYRHVRQLRRWLRAARSAPPLGRATR